MTRRIKRAGQPYPWQGWITWEGVVLTPGKDFDCQVNTFRVLAYNAASRLGYRVSVVTLDDGRLRVVRRKKVKR